MKWFTRKLSRKRKKLPGLQKKQFVNKCKEAANIVIETENSMHKVSMLEEGLSYIFEHYDKKTREGILLAVNHICDARNSARETLISREMIRKLKSKEAVAYTGILARNVVDILTSEGYAAKLEKGQRKRILRAVAMRLIMELDPEEIEDMTEQLMPSVVVEKEERRDRCMYG
jgi:predicted transcriptional regulator